MSENNGKQEELIFVSREDRLEAENLHLRVMKVAYEIKDLQTQLETKRKEIEEHQKKILAIRKTLEEKYSINLTTHEVREEDGAVVPRGSGIGVQQQLASMQARG